MYYLLYNTSYFMGKVIFWYELIIKTRQTIAIQLCKEKTSSTESA